MKKAIFFDWDGTLVDSLPMLFAAHNHVRGELGYPIWTREEYSQAIVFSSRELYPRLYSDRADEARGILMDYIGANHLREMKVMDGAAELLAHLFDQNVPMGIVSNKTHEFLGIEVRHLGWEKYFGVVNGSGVAPADKPSGVPLIHALGMHPDNPAIENVLYVGDMESDLGCARDAGCPVAFITGAPRSDKLIAHYNPAYVAHDLTELKTALGDFLKKRA